MPKLTVEVTSADVLHGVRGDCRRCAVARALLLQLDEQVEVDGVIVALLPGRWERSTVNLPLAAQEWIEKFDRGDDVGPISFELDMPERLS